MSDTFGGRNIEPLEPRRLLASVQPVEAVIPAGLTPTQMMPFGDRVMLIGSDQDHGSEVWISDGTAPGTRMIRDIIPGSAGAAPKLLGQHGSNFYFLEAGGMWRTDGTSANTIEVDQQLTLDQVTGARSLNGKLIFSWHIDANDYLDLPNEDSLFA